MPVAAAVAALLVTSLLVAVVPPAAASPGERRSEVRFRSAQQFALRQLARTDRRLAPGRFPTVSVGSKPWHTAGTGGWLGGFYPGRLWAAYEMTGDRAWSRRAARRQAPLAERAGDTTTHDLGFLLQTSFGRGAALTGSRDDAQVTQRAAASLATRWVDSVGAIRSWDGPPGQVTVIVDSLVNLELLFAASRLGGDRRWRDLAVAHALTVERELVRPDGSTFHVVRFDEATGAPVWRGTAQGLSDSSTWARGQAWAVYGFTAAWRESRERPLLDAARRTADFATRNLPGDGVPYWDYDAPGTADSTRDTTAAAVLASGLIELARVDPDASRRQRYARAGLHTLRALTGRRYLARGTGSVAILRHGHHNSTYGDAGVTYGDHYLLDALLRAQLLPAMAPALQARAKARAGGARADLGTARRVSGVSIRWPDGGQQATRFRVATSQDGRTWAMARGGVSSGRTGRFETYDLADRVARYVRVTVKGSGGVRSLRVLG